MWVPKHPSQSPTIPFFPDHLSRWDGEVDSGPSLEPPAQFFHSRIPSLPLNFCKQIIRQRLPGQGSPGLEKLMKVGWDVPQLNHF